MIKRYPLLALLTLLLVNNVFAQVPTNGDCLGAIPVCTSVYSYNSSANGAGNYTDLPNQGPASTNYCPTNCISAGEANSTWYTFTTQSAGTVNFVITPNDPADDYDWAVYNLTTNGCSGIYAPNGGMQVSCNYCMNTGPTGPNQTNAWACNGPNGCSAFNKEISSAANQTYALMVNNFSGSFNGYTISFGGTANVVDNVRPYISSLTTPVICGANTLSISFSENILCSSISGGDFTLTGPGGPYTISYISGASCNVGGTYENDYVLTVIPNMITGGTYTLWLSGAVLDICGNTSDPANANNSRTFTITAPSTVVTATPSSICPGGSTTLTASGATSYTWSGGLGTGTPKVVSPGSTTNYTVTGTTGGCSSINGVTVTVTPTPVGNIFTNPINFGTLTCQTYSDTKNNGTTNCFGNEYIGQASDDIYYSFTLAQAATVNISLCASGFDTYMYLLNSGGTVLATNDDSGPLCGGLSSSMTPSLAAGTYYVVAEGYSTNSGNINIQISFPTPAGSITTSATSVCQGDPVTFTSTTTSGTWSMFQYQWNGTGGAWTDWTTANPYTWTSGNGGNTLYVRGVYTSGPCTVYSNVVSVAVSAPSNAGTITGVPSSICDGSTVTYTLSGITGTFDYFQYQWDGTGGAWTNWGATNPYSWVAGNPGHTLYVRGVVTNAPCATAYSAPVSTYITAIPQGALISNPIAFGTLGCTSYSNTQNNVTTNCFGNQMGQTSDDIYYSFVLTASTVVNISHCGSGFDTYLHVLNSGGTEIYSNDDNGPLCAGTAASLQPTLAAGTYYIVSEGYGTYAGNINTQVSISTPSGGTVAGNNIVCYNTSNVSYSISGATTTATYTWAVPAGASVASGQGTSSITVNWGTAGSGNVSCTPVNGPCTGTTVNYAVTVIPANNWIGVTSTDWFTASNWCLGGIIPQTTTDVIIPNATLTPNDPNIAAAGAVCRNFTMQAGSITNITASNPLSVYGNWSDAGVFNEATGVVNFVASVAQSITTAETFYQLNIDNTAGVSINAANTVSDRLILTNGALTHGGNLTLANNATIERFTGSLTTAPVFGAGVNLIYRSTVNSGFEIPASTTVLRNMTLNTPAAGIVTLTTPATLNTQLTFTSGVLRTTAANLFTFADNSTWVGAANTRFIDGPVSKIGDDAFEFPTGDIVGATWVWAPLAIADPGVTTTDCFTTTYYFAPAPNHLLLSDMCNPLLLDHTSGVEYWDIQRVSGSIYPNVTLYWKDANRSGITSLTDLTTAHYENCAGPTKWVDKGGVGAGTLGVGGTGQITGSGFTSYSPVTFGAKKGTTNPLPVSLIEFYANCIDRIVHLSWSTASETNNDYFTIERSPDMNLWDQLAIVDGAGNSNTLRTYSYDDEAPFDGTSYYRLKQTDYDGASQTFSPVAVECISAAGSTQVMFYPNPFDESVVLQLNNATEESLTIRIYDMLGELVFSKKLEAASASQQEFILDLGPLSPGMYFVDVTSPHFVTTAKLVKQDR